MRIKSKSQLGCQVCGEPEMYRTIIGWYCLKHWEKLK